MFDNGMNQQQPMPQQQQQEPQPLQQEEQASGQASGLEFNQDFHKIILLRIKAEIEKNPQFGAEIEDGLMPAAAAELGVILPEILPVFRVAGLLDDSSTIEDEQQQNGGGMIAGQPSTNMVRPQQPRPDVGASPNPLMQDEEEDERPVSRGLVG